MADEECRNCRSWEEEMYWSHFQCHQFFRILDAGFHRQLPIPEHFTKNLKGKLPSSISVKGPSGSVWQVNLTKINGIVFICDGWDEFVNDNLLQENDLLIFKYNGASCFDVLIFDGQSSCEKAASYFVRKCGHKGQESVRQLKRKMGENSADATFPSPRDFNGAPTPEKSANNDIHSTPIRKSISSRVTTKKIRRPIEKRNAASVHEVENTPVRVPPEEINPAFVTQEDINPAPVSQEEINPSSVPQEEINPALVNENFSLPVHDSFSASSEETETKADFELISRGAVHDVPYISSISPVTEEDKMNALQLAKEALTSNGFMTVMKPTHVSRKFCLSIPSGWMRKHAHSLEKQDVILRSKGNMFNTKYHYQKSKNSGWLSGGWKSFVMDHNLQEHDVCVFEPQSHINNSIVLDVRIFRVHQEGW